MIFTQYFFPVGRHHHEHIDMPLAIEVMATEMRIAGWSFEIEVNPRTQVVSMDCCDEDGQLALELVRNGPGVPDAVVKMVTDAHRVWTSRDKPKAVGNRATR